MNSIIFKALCVVLMIGFAALLTGCHHHRGHRNNDSIVYTESSVGQPGPVGVEVPKHFSKTTIKM